MKDIRGKIHGKKQNVIPDFVVLGVFFGLGGCYVLKTISQKKSYSTFRETRVLGRRSGRHMCVKMYYADWLINRGLERGLNGGA